MPDKIKQQRRDYLLTLQQEIVFQRNKELIGSQQKILVESDLARDGYNGYGRTMGQAPEVDGVVYLKKGRALTGEIVNVKITAANEYDLVGDVI